MKNQTHLKTLPLFAHGWRAFYVMQLVMHEWNHVIFHDLLHVRILLNHRLVCRHHSMNAKLNHLQFIFRIFYFFAQSWSCVKNQDRFQEKFVFLKLSSKRINVQCCCVDVAFNQVSQFGFYFCCFCIFSAFYKVFVSFEKILSNTDVAWQRRWIWKQRKVSVYGKFVFILIKIRVKVVQWFKLNIKICCLMLNLRFQNSFFFAKMLKNV